MKPWLLLAALPLLGGCISLADVGEDPYAQRFEQPAHPGWWGRDAASVDIFFGSLGPWGAWQSHPGFGRVWFPHQVGAGWHPYWNGHWRADPRFGRRWVSHDPFGFATDHYGQWQRHPTRGWFWIPGTQFQPGWTAPPPGWRPRPAGWYPPASSRPGDRSPIAVAPGDRPDVWRPGDARRDRQSGRPGRPRGSGWQPAPQEAGFAPAGPSGAEQPAYRPAPDSRPARAERPYTAPGRAERPYAAPARAEPARAERPTVSRRNPTVSVQPY